MQALADAILVAVCAAAAVTDLRSGRIRNVVVYPGILVGLLLGLADGGLAGLGDHAMAAGLAFGIMFLCYAIGGMGEGDVKLMAAVGALGGFERAGQGNFILYAFLYAFGAGAALGLAALVWKRSVGLAAARTWWGVRMLAVHGTTLDEAVPEATIRVPFGFATAVGTVWLLAENAAGMTVADALRQAF